MPPKQITSNQYLPLMESYYTIQGEGANTGMPAYFIRLGGCDVGCHWCDVKESWDVEKHPLVSVEKIISSLKSAESAQSAVRGKAVNKYPVKNVVITGGEPLLYNLNELTKQLNKNGIKTFIETSGAYPLTGAWDWICLSPKKTKLPLKDIYKKANELKVIIYNKHDFKFAENCAAQLPSLKGRGRGWGYLFLQPEWSKKEIMLPKIIEYVKKNPQWKISLQMHKYMNIP